MARIQKEEIDSGFIIKGTGPEQEVLYDCLDIILNSDTGKPLLQLLNAKKKVTIAFQQKNSDTNLKEKPRGSFKPFVNQIFLNIVPLRSMEEKISTLTHELFHALQYRKTRFYIQLNKEDFQHAFLLNELEARFKSMEIISELYPYNSIINLNLEEQTKMDCLIYEAVSHYYKQALIKSGQKSESKAEKIARLLAKSEMLEAQAAGISGELHHLIGDIWSEAFDAINADWHDRCKQRYQNDWKDCGSIMKFLPVKKKPTLTMVSTHIANRLGIPHTVFQQKIAQKNRT